jgi:hypothetical protein
LQLLPPPVVVGLGLLTYGAGLFAMTTIALAPLCGALFGFGYGVTLPSSIEWSTRLYPQNPKARRPINSSFQAGSIIVNRPAPECRKWRKCFAPGPASLAAEAFVNPAPPAGHVPFNGRRPDPRDRPARSAMSTPRREAPAAGAGRSSGLRVAQTALAAIRR